MKMSKWKEPMFDELDEILIEPTDNPVPEGKEIDLDAIGREDMEDDERY